MSLKPILRVLVTAQVLACGLLRANIVDFIDMKMTNAMREYCHIVRFPQGWKINGLDLNGIPFRIDHQNSEYEFRVEGLLGTEFLVGAYNSQFDRHDATNHYRVKLSDPKAPVLPASRKDWEAAGVVPLVRKSIMPQRLGMPEYGWHDYQPVFNGFKFTKSGFTWENFDVASRLSPDSAWVVFQSSTKETKSPYLSVYQMFFDVFSANTGEKMLTMEGTYSGFDVPWGCIEHTAWLTERYLIIPLGKNRERCLVCEFGANRQ